MHSFFTRHKRTFFALTAAFLYSATIALATPPTTPYTPGETLNPSCVPGSANCTVSIFPDQTGNTGKYLTTDGNVVSWGSISTNNFANADLVFTSNRNHDLNQFDLRLSNTNSFLVERDDINNYASLQLNTSVSAYVEDYATGRYSDLLLSSNNLNNPGFEVNISDGSVFNDDAFFKMYQNPNIGIMMGAGRVVITSDNNSDATTARLQLGNPGSNMFSLYARNDANTVIHEVFGGYGGIPGELLARSFVSLTSTDGLLLRGGNDIAGFKEAYFQIGEYTTKAAGSTLTLKNPVSGEIEWINLNNLYFKQDGNSFGTLATIGTNDSNDLAFETNGTERAKINTSGNLLFYGSIKIGSSSSPHSSAALDISSTSKGVLFPRMTSAERTTISTPATGLHVYQTDTTEGSYVNLSGGWQRFLTTADIGTTITSDNIYNTNGSLTGARTLTLNGYNLDIAGTTTSRFFANGNVGIGTTTDAGYKLDVNGTARVVTSLTTPSIGTGSIQSATGPTLYLGTWGQTNLSFINGLASFSHNGTAPPIYGKFNIYSGNNTYAALHINSADGQIGYGNNIIFSNGAALTGSIYNSNYSLNDMGISNPNGYYLHMFPGGNISLGNGTPTDAGYKLDVNGSLHATGLVRFDGGGFTLNRTSGEPYIVYAYNSSNLAQIRMKSDGTLRFTGGDGNQSYWEMTPTQQLNQGGANFGSAKISISNNVNNPTIWARGNAGFTNNAVIKNMVYEGILGTGYNMADGFGTYNIYQVGSVDEGTFTSAHVGVRRNGGNSNWDYFIQSNSVGSITDKLILRHTGQLVLPKYGINTFTGTATYTLGVDASGNVVEVANASSDSFTAARAFTLNGYTFDIAGTTTSRFFANGNVGIGTTTDAGYKLDVNGTVAMSALTAATSSQDALCIVNGGTEVQRNTGAQTCTVSSARFKHDIQPLSGDILSVLTRFTPSTFIYNDQSNTRIGLIAEEVATIDPRLVFYEADGTTPRGVRYEDLSVVTLKGLQDITFTITNIEDLTTPNTLRDSLLAWLGDFGNGIGKIFAGTLQAKDQVCIDDVCINKEQLRTLIQNQPQPAPSAPVVSEPEPIPEADVAPQEVLEESPVISIPETVDTSSDTIQEPI